MVTTDVNINDPTTRSWHRWFRRTNVHTAEYIIMLGLFGTLLGLLVSQWYSFFGLITEDGYAARSLAQTAAIQLGSMLVVLPAAFWMYFRVTGQEGVQPDLQDSKPRTVFLTIWMIIAVSSLVGIFVGVVTALVRAVFGFNDNLGDQIIGQIIPGVFAAATVSFGIASIVKHVSRRFVKLAALVVAAMALVLLVANTIMIFVRKDSGSRPQRCTFSMYRDGDCSYNEYLKNTKNEDSSSDLTNPRQSSSFENLFDVN